ncbi:MAG TPA: ASCH domain-containing protein [Enterobacteriaceae bacterium]|nr:ASCH domain-containing protein [Enterobacteriaceae bacterium]
MPAAAQLLAKYPGATAWSFGDSPKLADELAALVLSGKKTATCSAMLACIQENALPVVGAVSIILDGRGKPVCAIRTLVTRLLRFNEVTESLVRKEGEGDLSLAHWQKEHRRFFEREGTWSAEMELVFEEFALIERF